LVKILGLGRPQQSQQSMLRLRPTAKVGPGFGGLCKVQSRYLDWWKLETSSTETGSLTGKDLDEGASKHERIEGLLCSRLWWLLLSSGKIRRSETETETASTTVKELQLALIWSCRVRR
jgi:hypothetical protein